MTRIVYPEERKLLSISNGKARVWQGAAETSTAEGELFGGIGGFVFETENLRLLMSRKEHRDLCDFFRLKQKYETSGSEQRKEAIRKIMLERFHTMDKELFMADVYKKMQADPRLEITTKSRQVIKTTVSQQKKFTAERSAGGKSTFVHR